MKIAYVFAYLGDGGTEDHAILLAKKAKESGNEPIFIISKYSESAIKKIKSFKFIELPLESSFNPIKVLLSVIKLKNIIKNEKIDLVHAHMLREQSIAIFAKILGGKFKLVRTFHRLNQFNWKMKPLMPFYLRYTDAVIAISDLMTKMLDDNGWGGSYTLIKNGVLRVDTGSHEKALGFIGRLTEEKGILQFIKSNTNLLKENKLVIAGDGPDYNEIKDFSQKNNLKIELLGSVLNKADFYKKASVLILPSSHEVLPLVVLEAFSCGMPVLLFDIPPHIGLIDDSNGAMIKYPNYKEMGQKAVEILQKSDNYKKTNIDLYNSRYSDEIMWNNTFSLYKSLLGK